MAIDFSGDFAISTPAPFPPTGEEIFQIIKVWGEKKIQSARALLRQLAKVETETEAVIETAPVNFQPLLQDEGKCFINGVPINEWVSLVLPEYEDGEALRIAESLKRISGEKIHIIG